MTRLLPSHRPIECPWIEEGHLRGWTHFMRNRPRRAVEFAVHQECDHIASRDSFEIRRQHEYRRVDRARSSRPGRIFFSSNRLKAAAPSGVNESFSADSNASSTLSARASPRSAIQAGNRWRSSWMARHRRASTGQFALPIEQRCIALLDQGRKQAFFRGIPCRFPGHRHRHPQREAYLGSSPNGLRRRGSPRPPSRTFALLLVTCLT